MLGRSLRSNFDKRTLRWLLGAIFVALLVPSLILIDQSQSRLKWETFHRYRIMAEELAARIDARLTNAIAIEEARSFADYSFLIVAGDPAANFLQRSDLSVYPVSSELPGLIAYFQVDAQGRLSTPLMPPDGVAASDYGIADAEYAQRAALEMRLHQLLSENRLLREPRKPDRQLVDASTLDQVKKERLNQPMLSAFDDNAASSLDHEVAAGQESAAQAEFDRLESSNFGGRTSGLTRYNALGSVAELPLEEVYSENKDQIAQKRAAATSAPKRSARSKRREQTSVPEPALSLASDERARESNRTALTISTFESELDPFDFSLLDSGHFVLFRKVWRDGERYIQGALIEQGPFIRGVIESAFRDTALSDMSDLVVAFQDSVLSGFSGKADRQYLRSSSELSGALLYNTPLSAPLSNLKLIFSVNQLPTGPGGTLIGWAAMLMIIVLCAGFYVMYRLGAGQIDLARQQQDFVSAVSHELKTPLTSIRMYGEMLKAGWADEDKKRSYYDFIYDESERLSRLINNVLQLARLTRNDPHIELKTMTVGELLDLTRSKAGTHVDRSGFELSIETEADAEQATVRVDDDCFTQIIINLVDNAIKFSANAVEKRIELRCSRLKDNTVCFALRDFGPGVPRDQMKKIFKLFYRSENELTRETVGTGIGLALVHQLVSAMRGRIDVRNREPGAEFRVFLPTG